MSGYGPGDYPGQGYDGDPARTRQRRGGGRRRDDRYENHEGYDPRGYAGQEHGAPGGYDGYGDAGYDRQGSGGYYPPGAQPAQPGQYGGTGGMPQQHGQPQYDQQQYDQQQYDQQQYDQQQYDQQGYDPRRGRGPRRPRGGYDQRRDGGRNPRAYDDQDPGDGDSSFMPGFGGRGEYDDGRYPREERGGRYDDYDDRRPPRGGRPGQGPGGRGPGGRGPDPRAWADAQDDYPEERRPRKKATRWLPRILVLTVVGAVVIGGLVGGLDVYHRYQARYHPADYAGPGTGDVTVQVKTGDTAFSLAPALVQLGVIASTRAFENAAEAQPATTNGLEAGYYQLHHHMQASLAYANLLNPKDRVQTTVTVPEGKRVSQVLTILAKYTKIPLSQFESAAKDTAALGLPSYAGTSAKLPATVPYGQLEGYLFPATYAITPHETPLEILQAMVQRFNVEAQEINIQQAAQSVGMTPNQLIVEASMVQAEAGLDSDMPKMARVILNRQARGMPDGFDSVVFYGLGKYGINIPNSMSPATAGQYDNTQKTGLPPTPIDNPGDAAIQAILHPASGDWLYFLTVATGKATEFSATPLPGTG